MDTPATLPEPLDKGLNDVLNAERYIAAWSKVWGHCRGTFTWVYADQVSLNRIPTEASIDENTHMLCLRASAHWFIIVTLLIATASCFCVYST